MTVNIDLSGAATPKEFHERVRRALDLPNWYGNNLDALYDVLSVQTELSVRFVCAAELRSAAPKYAAALERMCDDLSSESPGRSCTVEYGNTMARSDEETNAAEPASATPAEL